MIKKTTPMKLVSLKIERDTWGPTAGKLKGEATFNSNNARVYLNITEEHVQKILDMCADVLLETTKEMADVVRNDIIEGVTVEKRIKLK